MQTNCGDKDEKLCECGCGQVVKPGNRFIHGHYSKTLERRQRLSKRMSTNNPMNNPESRKKVSLSKVGTTLSSEARKKISEARAGKPLSGEHKRNISKSLTGDKNPFFGKKHTKETRLKMSKNHADFSGENHPQYGRRGSEAVNWRGGVSFEPYSSEWTKELKEKVRIRDNYKCQISGEWGNSVHHIDYNKGNCDEKNLITVCRKHNTMMNYSREVWMVHLQEIIRKRYR